MQEIHGPLEWVSLQDMARATEMCIKLAELWSEVHKGAPAARPAHERDSLPDTGSPVDWVG